MFGLVLVIAALCIKNGKKKQVVNTESLRVLLTKPRSNYFWHTGTIMSLGAVLWSVCSFFLYPVYLKEIGFDIFSIGAVMAFYSLVSGTTMLITTKYNVAVRKLVGGIFLFTIIPFLFIHVLSIQNAFLFFGIIALGDGFAGNLFERMVARIGAKSKNISTDIALLHIPYRITEFITLGGIGFFVMTYGFHLAFVAVAVVSALYALFAGRMANAKETLNTMNN